MPNEKLRDCADEQVSTRSPSPGQAHERHGSRAEGVAEPAQLGEAARDERRARARAQAPACGDAAGDRKHVLGRAADLDAANVARVIEPEIRPVQKPAKRSRQRVVRAGERHRGRQPRRHVGGEGWAGQDRDRPARRLLPQNLRHEGVRAALDALCAAHQGGRPRQSGELRAPRPGSPARASRPGWPRRTRVPRGRRWLSRPRPTAPRAACRSAASPRSARIRSAPRPQSTTSRPAAAAAFASAVPQAPAPATPTTPSRVMVLCPASVSPSPRRHEPSAEPDASLLGAPSQNACFGLGMGDADAARRLPRPAESLTPMPEIDLPTVIFALVALFVAYKLRSVLGTRNDGARPAGRASRPAAAGAGAGEPRGRRRGKRRREAAAPQAALPPATDRWKAVADRRSLERSRRDRRGGQEL